MASTKASADTCSFTKIKFSRYQSFLLNRKIKKLDSILASMDSAFYSKTRAFDEIRIFEKINKLSAV